MGRFGSIASTDARPQRARELADVRGHSPLRSLIAPDAAKDSHRIRNRLEKFGQLTDGLRSAERQDPTLAQRMMEQGQYLLLFCRLQIDQKVPTGDEIQARERWIGQYIVDRKDDGIAQFRAHSIALVLAREKARQPRRRHVGLDRLGIEAIAAVGHGLGAHVGREDLELRALLCCSERLQEQHGEGIGLLAGAATRNPDADRLIWRVLAHQFGNHRLRQCLVGERIAKEAGHMNQQILISTVGVDGRFTTSSAVDIALPTSQINAGTLPSGVLPE